MEGRYNTRSPAVKRLMREAQELSEPTDQYYAQPLEDNLFEWHFTVRGPADSDFQHGVYHGRIILPMDYPMKPPSIIWLTPNGRFETNKKICLSISGHHPESWQPSWSIRTALLAIIGFMPTRPGGAIGSLDYTPEERKVLAKKSQDWKCPACGSIDQILLERSAEQPQASQEAKDLAAQIQFQGEKSKSNEAKSSVTSSVAPTLSSATESTSSASTEPKLENQPNQQPQAVLLQPPGFSPWNFPGTMPAMTQGFPPPMTWISSSNDMARATTCTTCKCWLQSLSDDPKVSLPAKPTTNRCNSNAVLPTRFPNGSTTGLGCVPISANLPITSLTPSCDNCKVFTELSGFGQQQFHRFRKQQRCSSICNFIGTRTV
ncbi:hypothetical protein EGW08_005877 [Elysia chlorotica]|uniref:UBC core domain-containing protein n=1 Tax=Elysia chlorotica TaxID=188477 RepID=A0A3S1BQM7_ELYCH|nr:hypothetical protein EGW08_005877 [Elysia chlorotica]